MARDDRYDAKDPHEAERRGLLRQIEEEVAGTAHWLGKDRLAPAVMAAIAQVPRHAFVPRMEEAHAYRNEPLPIGLGQTISQPYIVAVMTDQALDGSAGGAVTRVLEVGTGSGYQAAVMAEAGGEVWTIEALQGIAAVAAARVEARSHTKRNCRQGGGADAGARTD